MTTDHYDAETRPATLRQWLDAVWRDTFDQSQSQTQAQHD